jgi:hypothetical protein
MAFASEESFGEVSGHISSLKFCCAASRANFVHRYEIVSDNHSERRTEEMKFPAATASCFS